MLGQQIDLIFLRFFYHIVFHMSENDTSVLNSFPDNGDVTNGENNHSARDTQSIISGAFICADTALKFLKKNRLGD